MFKILLIFALFSCTSAFDCFTCNSEPGEDDSSECLDRKETCPEGVQSCSMVTFRTVFDDKLHVRKFCTSPGTDLHDDLMFFPGAAICQNVVTKNNKITFEPIPPVPLVRAKRIRRNEPPAPPNTNIDSTLCVCSTELCNEGSASEVTERSLRHDISRVPDNSAKKTINDLQELA